MHDDELVQLRQLQGEIERLAQVVAAAIKWREDAAAEEKRRSGILIIGPWVAAALTAVGAVWRWVARNSAGVAAFGAGAVVATASTVAIGQIGDDPPPGRHVLTAPAPATSTTPPGARIPSPTRAPKRDPAPPTVTPTPTPSPESPGAPLPSTGSANPPHKPHKPPRPAGKPTKPAKPPHTPPGKPPKDDGDGSSTTKSDDCRINLPHLLGHGLLCGHPFG